MGGALFDRVTGLGVLREEGLLEGRGQVGGTKGVMTQQLVIGSRHGTRSLNRAGVDDCTLPI